MGTDFVLTIACVVIMFALLLRFYYLEFVAVDGFASSSIVIGKVAALAHELGNHPIQRNKMEKRSEITK